MPRSHHRHLLPAAALLLVAACGGNDAAAPSTASTTPTGVEASSPTEAPGTAPDTTAEPQPSEPPTTEPGAPPEEGPPVGLAVTVEAAVEGAVTALVTVDAGATLQLVGPDGTSYTLEFPPGAVATDTRVTATPIAVLEGELGARLVGGLDLQPDGLQLGRPAMLTIETANGAPPVEHQVPFGLAHDSEVAELAHPLPDASVVGVVVEHFSASGVLESTDARVELNRRLAEYEAQRASVYHQRMAEVSLRLREGTIGRDAALAEWETIRQALLRQHLEPRIEYARRLAGSGNPGDLEYVNGVVTEVLATYRQAVLLGLADEALPDDLRQLVAELITTARQAMLDRCLEEHDFTVIPLLVSLARSAVLLGIAEESDFDDGCGRFELHMTSRLEFPNYDIWPEIAATVEGAAVIGAVPGQDQELDWQWANLSDCPNRGTTTRPGLLSALEMQFAWPEDGEHRYRADGRDVPPGDVTVLYDIGDAESLISWDDCDQLSGNWTGSFVAEAWTALHAADATGPGGPPWQASGWTMLFDGPLVARWEVQQSATFKPCEVIIDVCWPMPVEIVETTTLELVHAP